MAFDINLATGARDKVGAPITRLSGSFSGLPKGSGSVNLMITDCTKTRKIKRLNRGGTGDAAFSLASSEIDPACQGLDPNADWFVYGQSGNDVSSPNKFPHDKTSHESTPVDIKKLKQTRIKDLGKAIKKNQTVIDALAKASASADKAAENTAGSEAVADAFAKASARAIEEAAKLAKENEDKEKEKAEREKEYERQFGEPLPK